MFTEEIWMTDKKFARNNLTPENFKEFVLEIEQENLKKLERDDKKSIVAKIIRSYEEGKKNGNQ